MSGIKRWLEQWMEEPDDDPVEIRDLMEVAPDVFAVIGPCGDPHPVGTHCRDCYAEVGGV
jgi:hypothetical protein